MLIFLDFVDDDDEFVMNFFDDFVWVFLDLMMMRMNLLFVIFLESIVGFWI